MLSTKYELNEKYSNFKSDLFDIKKHFDNSSDSIHKARNELCIAPINGIQTVIKAFKIPHIINQIVYAYYKYIYLERTESIPITKIKQNLKEDIT